MSKAVTVRKNQNAIDLALQAGGNLEGLFEVAALNGVTITGQPQQGAGLVPDATNQAAVYLAAKNIIIATGRETDDGSGIGHMVIEEDFIVS